MQKGKWYPACLGESSGGKIPTIKVCGVLLVRWTRDSHRSSCGPARLGSSRIVTRLESDEGLEAFSRPHRALCNSGGGGGADKSLADQGTARTSRRGERGDPVTRVCLTIRVHVWCPPCQHTKGEDQVLSVPKTWVMKASHTSDKIPQLPPPKWAEARDWNWGESEKNTFHPSHLRFKPRFVLHGTVTLKGMFICR